MVVYHQLIRRVRGATWSSFHLHSCRFLTIHCISSRRSNHWNCWRCSLRRDPDRFQHSLKQPSIRRPWTICCTTSRRSILRGCWRSRRCELGKRHHSIRPCSVRPCHHSVHPCHLPVRPQQLPPIRNSWTICCTKGHLHRHQIRFLAHSHSLRREVGILGLALPRRGWQ